MPIIRRTISSVLELADAVAEFLTGKRHVDEFDRILTTVLFTDIVGSTRLAASLGDQRWRALLDAHDEAVREQFRRFRGTEINTTGDGFMASFDGPALAIRCAKAIAEAPRRSWVYSCVLVCTPVSAKSVAVTSVDWSSILPLAFVR